MYNTGHRARLREKLKDDPTKLPDYEVLELLLAQVIPRQDTKPLAKELLLRFQTIKGVLEARPAELRLVKGFGPALEVYWILLRELMSRREEAPIRRREVLATPDLVAKMAKTRLAGNEKEELWLAFLDTQNRLISWERGLMGTVAGIICYPRDILERALLLKASAIILVHNHPGGAFMPSSQDIELTQQLASSAEKIGVQVLDHIIVTDENAYSLYQEKLLIFDK
ncbi:RadC family protein [Desulfovibrio litoralis]|uniref:DNA repair protein RadC n=1 Tax=Desulfovibrio litoralis DSM 11393 TaxID=1121455 RepID=A0A1M7TAW8_9BACT|nr:DNA repair protein RadC [Desulfovibrio litoralis]SHN67828.1 DNA repair protein RadC [Desulfovibrio litoralis DSM 11393]